MPNSTERATRVLMRLGIHPMDAQRAAAWVQAHKPRGTDAEDWIPDANALGGGVFGRPLTRDMVHDARVAWYASEDVGPRWKRVLDAVGGDNA